MLDQQVAWSYHYDAASNRLLASGTVAENGELSTETTAYSYDARGRMSSLQTLLMLAVHAREDGEAPA